MKGLKTSKPGVNLDFSGVSHSGAEKKKQPTGVLNVQPLSNLVPEGPSFITGLAADKTATCVSKAHTDTLVSGLQCIRNKSQNEKWEGNKLRNKKRKENKNSTSYMLGSQKQTELNMFEVASSWLESLSPSSFRFDSGYEAATTRCRSIFNNSCH